MILVRRRPRAFSAFVEALRLEEFEDLADRLECNWLTWWYKPTWDTASIYVCWRIDWRMPQSVFRRRLATWKIGGYCLLFSNGKINCNGKCLSLQDGRRRLLRYARKLQKMNYPVRLTNVRVVTASQLTNWPTETTRLDCQKTLVTNPNCFLPSCSDVTACISSVTCPERRLSRESSGRVTWTIFVTYC